MIELQKRMIECLQLRGLSERTQQSYLRAVRQLSEHYHKSPDLITETELRQYFLYLKCVKHYARPTMTIAICGIRFCYQHALNRHWTIFGIVRPAPEKKLPVILSRAEVRQILGGLRRPRYRVCLSTIYSCGLRLQEGTHLRVADIDSARMMIHVRHGKGAKDRYVPLPKRTLELLRQYWATHRNPLLLFPAEGREHISLRTATEPISKSSVQQAFRAALKASGNNKRASVHTLLHTWTRQLLYHPHVHYIVTGGGLTDDGRWRSSRKDFLVPEKALAVIFRAKLRDALKKAALFASVDRRVWKKRWVVDCEPVGSGEQAFKYLAPYIFRVALSNNRLLKLEHGNLTFTYKESATDQLKRCTVTAEEFIRRFLQHVLPKRFIKVRYYGLLSPSNRQLLQKARQLLSATSCIPKRQAVKTTAPVAAPRCPHCGTPLTLLSPSLPNSVYPPPHSVSGHKKTSLSGWLPLPLAQHLSPDPCFSSPGPSFPLGLAPFS